MNTQSRVVTFDPLGRSGPAKDNETVLDVARRTGAPIGNACGGIGICARCRVTVKSGAENLLPATSVEARVAGQRNLGEGERLACQAVVVGDCVVTTTYW